MKRILNYPNTTGALLALITFLVIVPIGTDIWQAITNRPEPTNAWLEVRSVNVASAPQGGNHNVIIDRDINRDFSADWVVTIRQITPDGRLDSLCARSGRNDYRTGTPPPLQNLRWWMDIPPNGPCQSAPPGQYIASFLWIVHTADGDREVRADSNVYAVWQRTDGR